MSFVSVLPMLPATPQAGLRIGRVGIVDVGLGPELGTIERIGAPVWGPAGESRTVTVRLARGPVVTATAVAPSALAAP